jgi:uncharacterized membrane protein
MRFVSFTTSDLSMRALAPFLLAAIPATLLAVSVLAGPFAYVLGMHVFSPTCHQLADRSPWFMGHQLAVCHRCAGIYAALPLGALLAPLIPGMRDRLNRYAPLLAGASLLPMALDWGLDATSIWINTPVSRAMTGAMFGAVAGAWFAWALLPLTRPGTSPK